MKEVKNGPQLTALVVSRMKALSSRSFRALQVQQTIHGTRECLPDQDSWLSR
jgi:hypothetical protein